MCAYASFGAPGLSRKVIARRAARLLKPGWTVNLGVGIPTLVSRYLDADAITIQTENGLLGVGPPPAPGQADPDLVDAGKQPITERRGASYFDSAASFSMIRGGHIDAAVLGALQVDAGAGSPTGRSRGSRSSASGAPWTSSPGCGR
jgi:3-oxoacid CoA-transferase subunit B